MVERTAERISSSVLERAFSGSLKRFYRDGEIVIEQGDADGNIYYIAQGYVKLVHRYRNGGQLILHILGKNEIFGANSIPNGKLLVMKSPRFLQELLIEEISAPLLAAESLDNAGSEVPMNGNGTALTQAVQEILDKLGLGIKATPSFLKDQYLAFMARVLRSPAKLAVIAGIAPHGLKELYFQPQRREIGSWDQKYLQEIIKQEFIEEVRTQAELALTKPLN